MPKIEGSASSLFGDTANERKKKVRTDIQSSCLSCVGAVICISRPGVDTTILLVNKPGGWMLVSSITLTFEMNTVASCVSYTFITQHGLNYSPLLAELSDALLLPGSSVLQYRVLVYGCIQKNLLCLLLL